MATRLASHVQWEIDEQANIVGYQVGNQKGNLGSVSGAGKAVLMGVFADSVGDQQFGTVNSLANNVAQARGSLWHWGALIGGKVRFAKNYSVSGTNSGPWSYNTINNGGQDWLSRYQAVLADMQANGIGYLYFGYPHNDGVFGVPAATTISNLRTMLDAFRLAGITLLVADRLGDSRTPNGSAPAGTTLQTMQSHNNTVSAWLDAYCAKYGISRYRQHAVTADPVTDAPLANVAFDNFLHPSSYGGGVIAVDNARTLNFPLLPRYEYPGANNWRNGLSNGMFQGTAGDATNFTGTFPDAWASYRTTAPTGLVTGTLARTDGRPGSYFTIAATATAAGDRVGGHSVITLNQAWTATTYTAKGARIRGSYGDHWIVTTIGTSTGSEPAAMAAPSNLGDTCTSGTVTYTRVETINPGDTFEVILTGQTLAASSATLGCMPTVLVNVLGTSIFGGGRINNPVAGSDVLPTCYQSVGAQFTASTSGTTTLTVSAMAAGSKNIAIGQTVWSAAGVNLGTIVDFGTGTGRAGTYILSGTSNVASTTMYADAPSPNGDWVVTGPRMSYDALRSAAYSLDVYIYNTMSNGLFAVFAPATVELVKITSA